MKAFAPHAGRGLKRCRCAKPLRFRSFAPHAGRGLKQHVNNLLPRLPVVFRPARGARIETVSEIRDLEVLLLSPRTRGAD